MHTFTKNISDETSTFRCRRADQPWNGGVGQQEFVDVEYESHFPEKKTSSSSNGNNKIVEGSLSVVRSKSNWHNMETIDLSESPYYIVQKKWTRLIYIDFADTRALVV